MATWRSAVSAVLEERIEDIPAPLGLVRAWGAPEEINEAAVRYCLEGSVDVLPLVVREIERLWGGGPATNVPEEVARQVVRVAVIRRLQVERGFRPIPGERRNIFYEVHQGVRRQETLERVALIHRMHEVLLRAEIDPMAVATVHIDRAAETESRGEHGETEVYLAQAYDWTRRIEDDPSRRDYGAVCVAQSLWYRGEYEDARRRLRGLEGEKAIVALREIEAKDEEREALRRAEEEHALRGDVESWCAVAVAYLGARHTVRAELVAREVCERHPESGLAWGTRATLLFELGRFRDAVEPARTSLALGADEPGGRALLARILARIGPEGREESAELAAAEIEGAESPRLLSSELLADLAVIMHYAGTDIRHARRADDLVWERRSVEEPPPEWLGAAAARRCHGVWAEDAPEWLARLAIASNAAPAALAVCRRTD